ncbi:MAG: hypothetical protein BRC48_02220 [Cyanobacteria bacterium QS_9_48_30]|nr:MAG: hypothetical protein BRC43_07735 [Cyanobacteria bacterium QS_3_48_167]PSO98460.1 MAG: hypothetical protein BRC48_02220 [Cyanobacteria bacterium QS_9_48_30]
MSTWEFYKKQGFAKKGQPFESLGIPHIKMEMALGSRTIVTSQT